MNGSPIPQREYFERLIADARDAHRREHEQMEVHRKEEAVDHEGKHAKMNEIREQLASQREEFATRDQVEGLVLRIGNLEASANRVIQFADDLSKIQTSVKEIEKREDRRDGAISVVRFIGFGAFFTASLALIGLVLRVAGVIQAPAGAP